MGDTKRIIERFGSKEIVVFREKEFDSAIVDIVEDNDKNEIYAIYDYNKLINILVNQEGMNEENATEYISEISRFREPIILFPEI